MGSDHQIQMRPFSELLERVVDNRGKTCPTSEKGIPLIATNCIRNENLYPTYDKLRYVSEETYNTWFRGHPEPGDIIFVNKGTPGRTCLVPDPVDFCIAQDMVAIRANEEQVDQGYLLAALRSPRVQTDIVNMHVGTLIPHFKKGDFQRLLIPVPFDKRIQKAIGHIYLSFSKKIELNRQMNRTLESMAQALFKSWFIDFDPVKAKAEGCDTGLPKKIADLFPDRFVDSELGKIPEGWEVKPLSEIVNIIGGGTPKTKNHEYWGGDIPWFSVVDAPGDSDVFVIDTEKHITKLGVDNSSTIILRKGTTIISARGTVGKCALVGEPMAMNQSCYGIQGREEISDHFVYYTIRNQVSDLQRSGHGSVFNTITRDTFKSIKFVVPPVETTLIYEKKSNPFMEGILSNLIEIDFLTSLRDTLLPKLISGELGVPDVEKFVEDVLTREASDNEQ